MSEPTIQELIDEFRNEVWSEACNADDNVEEARSALLSHITQIQDDLEHEINEKLTISEAKGSMIDYLRKERDEWHKMAEQFYKLLLNYAKFDTVDAGIVFGNYMLKYHNLVECYPHAYPSEDTSVEGTEVKE